MLADFKYAQDGAVAASMFILNFYATVLSKIRHLKENGMIKEGKAWLNEADIGSGEKTPGEKDTEREIDKINPGKSSDAGKAKEDEKRKGLLDEDHPFPPKGN
jgi:hypothetical protein